MALYIYSQSTENSHYPQMRVVTILIIDKHSIKHQN